MNPTPAPLLAQCPVPDPRRAVGAMSFRVGSAKTAVSGKAEPPQPGMAEERTLKPQRFAHRRLARRSSELTTVLSRAAITTTKAI